MTKQPTPTTPYARFTASLPAPNPPPGDSGSIIADWTGRIMRPGHVNPALQLTNVRVARAMEVPLKTRLPAGIGMHPHRGHPKAALAANRVVPFKMTRLG
jgi:hypothetical protein